MSKNQWEATISLVRGLGPRISVPGNAGPGQWLGEGCPNKDLVPYRLLKTRLSQGAGIKHDQENGANRLLGFSRGQIHQIRQRQPGPSPVIRLRTSYLYEKWVARMDVNYPVAAHRFVHGKFRSGSGFCKNPHLKITVMCRGLRSLDAGGCAGVFLSNSVFRTRSWGAKINRTMTPNNKQTAC